MAFFLQPSSPPSFQKLNTKMTSFHLHRVMWSHLSKYVMCTCTVGLNLHETLKKMLKQAKHIFDTFEYFWVDHKSKNFCNCLATRWRCNQFFQKSPKSKSDNTFTLKKPFVTPTFCKRNLSQMHHFRTVNYFTFKIALVWDRDWVRDCLKTEQFWN